jgi:hypothetical protein
MPKLTKTGEEIGSSNAATIVLHKNQYGDTRQKELVRTKRARRGEELTDDGRNWEAKLRGTELEVGVAGWALALLRRQIIGDVDMWEPKEAFRHLEYRIASSVDRIIEMKGDKAELVLTWLGKEYRMTGTGICEIKTDAYHDGRPKPEWMIQVQHQMICTDLDWGIIACMDQHFKLHFYPVRRDQALIDVMLKAYAGFWHLVDTDGDYPPVETNDNAKLVDITEMLPKTNHDLSAMCADYLRASAEANQWEKTRKQLREGIIFVLDSMDVEHAKMPGFIIKSKTVTKPRRKSIETEETYESVSFSVKEVNDE